jgi:general secretion pathway protein A
MYLNYFRFKKEPFNITPDPEFLYLSPAHREALAAIIYGVEQRKGFVAIVGEVGVGKTTILRSFLDRIDRKQLRPIYLFNANISFGNLLKVIYRELGLATSPDNLFDMVDFLHEQLIKEYAQGRNIVLIIDEAHNMPVETLENLRMLSNLETTKEKLIQIVFSAQPEFEQLLDKKELRQLKQRIAVKSTIRPLSREESLAYIKHRLALAVSGTTSIFASGAMKLIADHAKGIPRSINILCDNSLITSYGYKRHMVNERIAREIIADFDKTGRAAARWWPVFAAVCVTVSCAGGLYLYAASSFLNGGQSLPAKSVRLSIDRAAEGNQPHQPFPRQGDRPAPAVRADAESDITGQEPQGMVSTTIKKGDTLAKLIVDRYGYVNRKALELVKQNNPMIKDENRIVEGERIQFPAVDR